MLIVMVWPAIIGAGAAIGGAVLSKKGASDQNKASRREAQRNRDFQERMRNTEWQSAVADMEAAGINPALAYSQGGASTPGGAQAPIVDELQNVASSAQQMRAHQKSMDLLDAQIDKARGEASSARAKGQFDSWRTRAMLNMKMDWDGDGSREQLALDMLRNEWLQGLFSMHQTRNLSNLSGLGGDAAAAFRPGLRSFSRMSGRGISALGRGAEGLERMSSEELFRNLTSGWDWLKGQLRRNWR